MIPVRAEWKCDFNKEKVNSCQVGILIEGLREKTHNLQVMSLAECSSQYDFEKYILCLKRLLMNKKQLP